MSNPDNDDVQCRYHYDPLDRMIGTTPSRSGGVQRFYNKSRLTTEFQGAMRRSIFQHNDQLLAQQTKQDDSVEISLLATDQMRSLLQLIKVSRSAPINYSPYGYHQAGSHLLSSLGFNGEWRDPTTENYLLGNGYRAFSLLLMQFNNSDNLSPFGKGGLNSYAYCLGDPVNREDPTGKFSWLRGIDSMLGIIDKGTRNFLNSAKKVNLKSTKGTLSGSRASGRATQDILENKLSAFIRSEYREFDQFQNEMNKSLAKTISSQKDLNSLVKNYNYKFVFTDERQLVVGGSPGTKHYHYLSHPVLSQYSKSQRIVSAGYVTNRGNNVFELDHRTGHYGAPFETLLPVRAYLRGLGAEITLIRLF